MNTVCQSLSEVAVMADLGIFQFYPCEISIHFICEDKLTLLLAICRGEVIKTIIQMHDLSNFFVCLVGDCSLGLFETFGFN